MSTFFLTRFLKKLCRKEPAGKIGFFFLTLSPLKVNLEAL